MPEVLKIPTAKVFLPLLSPSRYKGAFGGRSSGKSHFFAELAIELCVQKPGTRIVCVREVQKALKESVKLLMEDKIASLEVTGFTILSDRIDTPGGGIILFQGMQDHTAESIKSLEGFDRAYVEEAQTLTKRSLEMLRPTIRKPKSEIWFSWNPRHASDPVDEFLRGPIPPPDAIVVRTNYDRNPFFPDVMTEERLYDEQHTRDRYGHIWLGDYEPAAIGAIWNRLILHNGRVEEAPEMSRIVVSVDPAVSSEEKSNEHGIIVAGIGSDGRGYVLDDVTCKGGPQQWAERAIAALDRYEADAIVIEINQGGDMVKHTLKTIRPNLRIIEVRATRGKHVRAEPIAALYTTGKISHVGAFPQLEDQLCLFTAAGYEGEGSPDRADALVWALTQLFPNLTKKTRDKGNRPTRANSGYKPHRWRQHA
ncbi:MAG TPA: PBSX family phage terminase large subunit [Marinobacter sp.]|uniref:Phage terminase large subunit N-terminal domain-containing protein n=1 Tax=marine sediment metagenome TaxID=412755 RepID=A0A0F9RFH3_9ZZZZ|nr:PBSX family phage terminase large subunit [Marinobacter sp.]